MGIYGMVLGFGADVEVGAGAREIKKMAWPTRANAFHLKGF